MKTFEYCVKYGPGAAAIEQEAQLNQMGKDGWELVGVYDQDIASSVFYFKRQIGDDPPIIVNLSLPGAAGYPQPHFGGGGQKDPSGSGGGDQGGPEGTSGDKVRELPPGLG